MSGRFYESTDDHHLKPMHLSQIHNHSSASLTSTFSTNTTPQTTTYHALPHDTNEETRSLHDLTHRDTTLKRRIRLLRIISRLLATLVSLATLIPLLITLTKFLQTRDVHFTVNGKSRTAWANDSLPWYTYMYTAVAGVSFVLNFVVVVSYCRGIRAANQAANVGTWWTWAVVLSHVVTWGVAAGVYRYGKPDKNGKHRDLWGWTCSDTAQELQHVLANVDFARYCNIQSSSFYSGIANVVLGLLTLVITIMALVRTKTKKKRAARAATLKAGTDFEPLRG
ncbi:hypothetical protein M409DRAFT_64326 [Zasmidium cellare ATCC 36951]|uniref:MARVEL domain-containing protein n=1 Tax=Zasmidium cellare ATCC 36951 TaxID=1080233 RepID=A0A6A6CVF6_ZASCE|nr:uncharacterized protein M409DRAFT_64326 [Zasmidium cellare ATCC 36951]KAF2170693.1 hypothetical protein M409DRAFT_64326 [Zasmidium cellare ATCC 36951]